MVGIMWFFCAFIGDVNFVGECDDEVWVVWYVKERCW